MSKKIENYVIALGICLFLAKLYLWITARFVLGFEKEICDTFMYICVAEIGNPFFYGSMDYNCKDDNYLKKFSLISTALAVTAGITMVACGTILYIRNL